MTTHKDDQNRKIVFDYLPKSMKNYHTIGRLDYMSEGLILLTNSAELKEKMERGSLPRVYEVKIKGKPHSKLKETLNSGMQIQHIKYKPIKLEIKKQNNGGSSWLSLTLTEGKNREIREILGQLDYSILRLVRVSYGIYKLRNLEKGKFLEVKN